jgi:hypothetical protein
LINTCDGIAIGDLFSSFAFVSTLKPPLGAKFGVAFSGEWVWQWKDKIDNSFMDMFRPETLETTPIEFLPSRPQSELTAISGALRGKTISSFDQTKTETGNIDADVYSLLHGDEVGIDVATAVLKRMETDLVFREEVVAGLGK